VERGIAVVAGGVFNSGILADPNSDTHYNYLPAPAELIRRALELKAKCERRGVDLKAAAIQFPLRHPAIPVVLTGPRSVAELEENIRMFQAPIPDELWAELDG
jgi:D-threo-aldose 1-dehydrogenase